MDYRPDIDGLRALAVAAVVMHHAGCGCSGGYVGVDVFFVISGFLIARRMSTEVENGTFSLVQFWERRIRRLLPALCVVVTASLVAGWFWLQPRSYQMFGRSLVSLAVLRANIFFARHTDYFSPSVDDKPLLHTWSLAVEEQFYLAAPLVFWGAMRLRRTAWIGPAAALAAVACFLYGASRTMSDPQAYYRLSTRAWEPLIGVLIATYASRGGVRSRPVREALSIAGLAAIVVSCCVYDSQTPYPGYAALLPASGAAVLIVAGGIDPRGTAVHRLLASRPAVGVGLVSYSLYLWHWPLLAFLKQVAPDPKLALRLPVAAFAGVLAWLTYRLIEQPFRRRDRCATRSRMFMFAGGAVGTMLLAGQMLRWTDGALVRLPESAQRFVRTSRQLDQFNRQHAAPDVPHALLRIGAERIAPRMLVWGDSHAMAVLPAVDAACRASGIAARCAVAASRPPVVRHQEHVSEHELAAANAFGAAVLRYATSDEVEVVLLAALWSSYFGRSGFEEALSETVDALRAAGKKVYFLRDVPVYRFNVAETLVAAAWRGDDLRRASFALDDYRRQNRRQDEWLSGRADLGIEILDPIPLLQTDRTSAVIPAFDDGGSYYCDANHLSAYGALRLQPLFARPAEAAVAGSRRTAFVADESTSMAR